MPNSNNHAINFLESQWSDKNKNKIKGITAELRFEAFLKTASVSQLYKYLIPGGWIMEPSQNTIINPPTQGRIAIIPIPTAFSWSGNVTTLPFPAQVLAESYFSQVGISTYFTKYDTQRNINIENTFVIPATKNYQTAYTLDFFKISTLGLIPETLPVIMRNFTNRKGLVGLRAYINNKINSNQYPWNDVQLVTNLFWKEYSRYFLHRRFLASANDLDFFLIGLSNKAYPVEFKSKTVVSNSKMGDWFGLDIGPFAKLSYFVSLSNNMEALYFVEEVDKNGLTLDYWGVKFTELLRNCFWVSQAGGKGMGGGVSNTVKIPKSIFRNLQTFLPSL